ncbi:MAG: DNA-directed RNA polymerase subunit L [Candidatus Anstonellaceae archaeon]
MEIEVIKNEKDYLEIALKGEDVGFVNALKEFLLADDDVEFAAYRLDHPLVASPVLMVRTKGSAPVSALKTAIKKLKKEAEEFKDSLKFAKKSRAK